MNDLNIKNEDMNTENKSAQVIKFPSMPTDRQVGNSGILIIAAAAIIRVNQVT
jgi:hypothetical protein